VRFPPPLLFVAGLALAWFHDTRLAFWIDGTGASPIQRVIGAALIASGLGVMLSGIVTFTRARTAIYPNQPARQLVTWGPYAFTRNPMYLGLTLAYLGAAGVLNSAWPLVLLPGVLLLVYWLVIRREERYLSGEFGDQYDAYRRRVRRWI
jgi:protein-S-isoprenylcysteine O-methyltransferase Ste14